MATQIELVPHDDRGIELLDELEERTEELLFRTNIRTGARAYWLEDAGTEGFDAMLHSIDPGWREHLTRSA